MGLDLGKSIVSMTDIHTVDSQPPMIQPQTLVYSQNVAVPKIEGPIGDRLDTELLMRAFLGLLGGEKGHCSMAVIPTVDKEDARQPNRERDRLVREGTRIVNRIKAILARSGIRAFKPILRNAKQLESLRAQKALCCQRTRAPN